MPSDGTQTWLVPWYAAARALEWCGGDEACDEPFEEAFDEDAAGWEAGARWTTAAGAGAATACGRPSGSAWRCAVPAGFGAGSGAGSGAGARIAGARDA